MELKEQIQQMFKEVEDAKISEDEGIFLATLASTINEGEIVEIGSWNGTSTSCLIKGSNKTIFSVDPFCGNHCPHRNYNQKILGKSLQEGKLFKTLERFGLDDKLILILQYSEIASGFFDKPIGLLFVDGDHSEDACYIDLCSWSPKVLVGGYIAIHDCSYPDVKNSYEKFLKENKNYVLLTVWGDFKLPVFSTALIKRVG